MQPNHERSSRRHRLTAPRPITTDLDSLDEFENEDELWEALPDTIPLDPKIIALAETLYDDDFPEI